MRERHSREMAALREQLNSATSGAAEAWQEVATLQDELDVLRGHRVSGLLETVAEKDAKIKQLGARQTLNKRRISDCNLERRRVQARRCAPATSGLQPRTRPLREPLSNHAGRRAPPAPSRQGARGR